MPCRLNDHEARTKEGKPQHTSKSPRLEHVPCDPAPLSYNLSSLINNTPKALYGRFVNISVDLLRPPSDAAKNETVGL